MTAAILRGSFATIAALLFIACKEEKPRLSYAAQFILADIEHKRIVHPDGSRCEINP